MKRYSLDELKVLAADVFRSNPTADELIAFGDGNFFLPRNKNAAENYGRQLGARNGGKEPEKSFIITRESLPVLSGKVASAAKATKVADPSAKSVKELQAELKELLGTGEPVAIDNKDKLLALIAEATQAKEKAQDDAATKDAKKATAVGNAAQPAASGTTQDEWKDKTNAEIKAELTIRGIDSSKAKNKTQLLALLK